MKLFRVHLQLSAFAAVLQPIATTLPPPSSSHATQDRRGLHGERTEGALEGSPPSVRRCSRLLSGPGALAVAGPSYVLNFEFGAQFERVLSQGEYGGIGWALRNRRIVRVGSWRRCLLDVMVHFPLLFPFHQIEYAPACAWRESVPGKSTSWEGDRADEDTSEAVHTAEVCRLRDTFHLSPQDYEPSEQFFHQCQ